MNISIYNIQKSFFFFYFEVEWHLYMTTSLLSCTSVNPTCSIWVYHFNIFLSLACEFYHQSNKTSPIVIGHGGWGGVSETADNKCTTTQYEMGSDLASSNLHHQHSWKGKMNLCSDGACFLQSIFFWRTFEGSCLTVLYLNYLAIPSWDARNQTLILCIFKLSAQWLS